MSANRRIRVLVVDDHATVLAGLAAIVGDEPDMQVVGQARSGAQALALFVRQRPDVALVGFSAPGVHAVNGADTIAAIHRAEPQARSVALTLYGGDEDLRHAMEAGAGAYLFKGASREEILRAIRVVHNGGAYLPPEAEDAQGGLR